MQGCGERGILHKDEEGGLRTQLLIQREEEERGRDLTQESYREGDRAVQSPDRYYTCVALSNSAF